MQIAGTNLETALRNAISGGYVAEMSGQSYTVAQPIVIDVMSPIQGSMGIDLGGATIMSQVSGGQPVIQINAGPGVDLRYLTLSNFTIQGNGSEGAGIKIVADGNDRWIYNFSIENVTVRGVGGYGLDVQGSVFEGLVSNSSMIGNRLGGAYFGHLDSGGQVSALRWFGGTLEGNGGAGIFLGNGARDLSVDGVTIAANAGYGISAEWGITSVTDSSFRDNQTDGIWFQNFGYFNNNTFQTSGVQGTGIAGWVTGQTTVTGSRSVYTGSGSDPTVLANLQGPGSAYIVGDTGKLITGSTLTVSGLGGGNEVQVSTSNQGAGIPWSSSLASVASTATASSTGTGTFESALRSALTGGTVANLSGTTFTVTTPIVIYLGNSSQGPAGIDFGGAKILSQVTGGRPVIEIVAGPGVNVGNLTLSNFSIAGNGGEGDGIRIVAAGADRSINLAMDNVQIEHVGGIGLDVLGNVSGKVVDSWVHGNNGGGARFANSGGGTADGLQWIGGGFRKNGVAGLVLDNGASDMSVQGAYFVENDGAGIYAISGIALVEQTGFENNAGAGAWVGGSSTFLANSFSTYGPQKVGIAGTLNGGKVVSIGSGGEYYGGGTDPTAYMNLQGSGTLSIVGDGKVIAGSGISVTGGSTLPTGSSSTPAGNTTAPVVVSIAAPGTGITNGSDLTAGSGTVTDVAGNAAGLSDAITHDPAGSLQADVSGGSLVQPPASGLGFTSISTADGKATLTGSAGAGDQISIYDGPTWLGFADTGSNGIWSFTGNANPGATHTYGINATDLAGNVRSAGGQALLGSDGADTLTGSPGNDVIAGGAGADSLTGGGGADTFALTAALKGSVDRITDFASGTDKLALAQSAFGALSPGELSAAAFVQAAAAFTSGQRIIYNQTTGILSYDADGSGGGAAVPVAQLNAGQVLQPQDIKVY